MKVKSGIKEVFGRERKDGEKLLTEVRQKANAEHLSAIILIIQICG